MASTLFEKSALSKLRFTNKPRPIRIMVVGQRGVGKTAMVVRFITRRFIGDYDSTTDKTYKYSTFIDNEMMTFEIVDTPGVRNPGAEDADSTANMDAHNHNSADSITSASASHPRTSSPPAAAADTSTTSDSTADADLSALERHIQHADAFILMYSVTDRCSFDDCTRLRFLINYNSGNKRRRRSITTGVGGASSGSGSADILPDIPVMLVGNKKDQRDDRAVDVAQGRQMYQQIGCAGFHEISVRESADEVWNVFRDVCRCWRIYQHYPKLRRSTSDAQTISYMLLSPEIAMENGAGAGNGSGGSGSNGNSSAGAPTSAQPSSSSSSSGYFDGWWSRSAEKRQSIFGFRSNNGGGSSSSSSAGPFAAAVSCGSGSGGGVLTPSASQSPSVEDVDSTVVASTTSTTTTTATATRPKLSIRIPSTFQQQQLQSSQQQQQLQLLQLQQPFRERASTDGKILSRPRRWQYMMAGAGTASTGGVSGAGGSGLPALPAPVRVERRMSISQRGSSGN